MTQKIEARVISHSFLTDSVIECEFEPVSARLPEWDAGSHVDLHIPNGISRQYSLIPSSTDSYNWKIAFEVINKSNGATAYLRENLTNGLLLKFGTPRNLFQFRSNHKNIFLAGGIGITPFFSMIEVAESKNLDWELHYLGKSKDLLAYHDFFIKNFPTKTNFYFSEQGSRFSLEALISNYDSESDLYVCGPDSLMVEAENNFPDPSRLHLERFSPKNEIYGENKSFEVIARKSGLSFLVDSDESILVAADFQGIDVDGDCLEGTCGACETTIIQGEVEHRDSILSELEKKQSCKMMICVSRAAGQRIVLDL
jgi:ferredoxin-NADP reductase